MPRRNRSRVSGVARSVADRPRAESADLPQWIKPQLTKLVDEPPEGSEWLHEIKFDGYRMHARLELGHGPAAYPNWSRLDA